MGTHMKQFLRATYLTWLETNPRAVNDNEDDLHELVARRQQLFNQQQVSEAKGKHMDRVDFRDQESMWNYVHAWWEYVTKIGYDTKGWYVLTTHDHEPTIVVC